MAPADDPKLIVYVAVQQPEIDHYSMGSIPVSMLFNPVMKNSLQYLNIQPSQQAKSLYSKLANLNDQNVAETVNKLKEQGLEVVVLGTGSKVTGQLPAANTNVLEGEKIILQTEGDLIAPNMTGWSLRDVNEGSQIIRRKTKFNGSGYVVKQNITEGTILRKEEFLIVDLKTPKEKLIFEAEKTKADENSELSDEDVEKLHKSNDRRANSSSNRSNQIRTSI